MTVEVERVESTLYVPFKKFEEQDDGSVMVYGLASGPDTDLDGQRMDAEWLKQAMPEWMLRGNIREMHQPKAVGKAKEYQWTAEGPYIASKIIDPQAIEKVKEGIYSGYSIGVKNAQIIPDKDAPRGKIAGGQIVEVSVVDFPAYPKAKFSLVKAADAGWQDMQTGIVLEKTDDGEEVTKMNDTPIQSEEQEEATCQKVSKPTIAKGGNQMDAIMTQFKEIKEAIEALAKQFGDTTFLGGESNNLPDNEGDAAVQQTDHQPPDPAEALGAVKGADPLMSKIDEVLAKFTTLDQRIQRIENQPAPTEVATMVVDRKHALDPDTKKSYQSTVSTLADQVSKLDDKEREKLAAEIIKMVHSR